MFSFFQKIVGVMAIYTKILLIGILCLFNFSRAQNSCLPGYYLPPSETECAACPAGTYQPFSGAVGCIPCSDGYFSSSEASTTCTQCQSSEVSNTYHTACVCGPGYEFDYYDGVGCMICPAGTAWEGYDDYSYCSSCYPGTFQPNEGATSCMNCPDGSSSTYGATQCLSCDDGQGIVDGSCGQCPSGHYYDMYDGSCYECYPGSYQPNAGISSGCQTCPSGSYSGYGASSCVTCGKNEALMEDGSCGSCDAGQYYDMYSLTCEQCYGNSFTPKNRIYLSCFNCGVNSYSFMGSKKCKSCKEGETLVASGKCGTCPPGTFVDIYDGRKCNPCMVNTYSVGGIMEYCQECPYEMYALPGSSKCVGCPADEAIIVSIGGCGICPAGKYYDSYYGECYDCYDGEFKANPGNGYCESCPTGSVSTDDHTACVVP